ncbi:MAG TPA: alkaline phosphatase [Elusimicrobiota bacterium]|nr:alkaline phosphatase [Elusimicrobiota bacterium]
MKSKTALIPLLTALMFLIPGRPLHGAPKNVILFIGDGMGPEQIKAAGIYKNGQSGSLNFESFPHQGTFTTYSADNAVTDSAAAATAIATGHKVNNGVVSQQTPGDGSELETLLEYFKTRGKKTGLVTTTYITHATPACFGAHESSRNNETEIAGDFLNQTLPDVLYGGGAHGMTPADALTAGYTVVTDRSEMQSLDTETVARVSGQFGTSYLPFEADGLGTLPHLSEMTASALAVLDGDADGFFLMVEGGIIDTAGHANHLQRNIFETIEFSSAVQVALDWAQGRTDTLILVTADHETGGLTVTQNNGQGNLPDVTWASVDHTATDVPAYARGPNSGLVSGTMNNTDIFRICTVDTADINGHVRDLRGTGLSGMTLVLSGDVSTSTVTDASGYYEFATLFSTVSYTVMPSSSATLQFSPAQRDYNPLGPTKTAADFTRKNYSIGGTLRDIHSQPISGASMTLSGGSSAASTTDSGGAYAFSMLTPSLDYTLTPSRTGYDFTPVSKSVTSLQSDQTNVDFQGIVTPLNTSIPSTDPVSLQYELPAGKIDLNLPSQVFGETVTLTLSEPGSFPPMSSTHGNLRGINVGVEITNDKNLQPRREISLTLRYRDSDVTGLDESALKVAYYDGTTATWTPCPSTPDPARNQVTALLQHLSVFQIVAMAPPANIDRVIAYPNPFRPGLGHARITFTNLTQDATLHIYTSSGELVKKLSADTSGQAFWTGHNDHGNRVASGVYFVLVKDGEDTKRLKLAVIR